MNSVTLELPSQPGGAAHFCALEWEGLPPSMYSVNVTGPMETASAFILYTVELGPEWAPGWTWGVGTRPAARGGVLGEFPSEGDWVAGFDLRGYRSPALAIGWVGGPYIITAEASSTPGSHLPRTEQAASFAFLRDRDMADEPTASSWPGPLYYEHSMLMGDRGTVLLGLETRYRGGNVTIHLRGADEEVT